MVVMVAMTVMMVIMVMTVIMVIMVMIQATGHSRGTHGGGAPVLGTSPRGRRRRGGGGGGCGELGLELGGCLRHCLWRATTLYLISRVPHGGTLELSEGALESERRPVAPALAR